MTPGHDAVVITVAIYIRTCMEEDALYGVITGAIPVEAAIFRLYIG